MATSQMKKETKSGTWSSIFSSSEQLNEQQSSLFVKKLLAVAISSVTYLRAVFPERCFGDRSLEDINLKILRDEDAFPGSSQVIQWVKGCFDAIDKKFLRKIILGFYLNANDPDTVIETYTFKFDYYCEGINIYRNNEEIASAKTADETKKATIRLLRTLVLLTNTLKSLPDDVMMTMKILYFDDVTPSDYEPPGFEATDYLGPSFKDEPHKLSLGNVSTPFHLVGLRVQSQLHQMKLVDLVKNVMEEEVEVNRKEIDENNSYLDNDADHAKIDSEEEDQQNKNVVSKDTSSDSENPFVFPEHEKPAAKSLFELRSQSKKKSTKKAADEDEAMECSTVPVHTPDIHAGPNDAANGANSRVSTPASQVDEQLVPKSDEVTVECSCGYNGDDGLMILCGDCNTWQHAACYLCFTEEECPALHICVSCAKNENKECTEKTLTGMNPITLQTTCLWRRALVGCRKSTRLTVPKFAERLGVESTVAQGLMKRMQNEGFLRQAAKGKRLGKLVSKEKLTIEALKKYFNPSEDEDEVPESAHEQNENKAPMNYNKKISLKDENEELQQMVNKAAQIDISGKYRTRSETAKASQDAVDHKRKERSRKRVISMVDDDVEFPICDSQDPMDYYEVGNSAKKMKKASVAEKAILI